LGRHGGAPLKGRQIKRRYNTGQTLRISRQGEPFFLDVSEGVKPGMCLAPAVWPEGPASKGQESLAQGLPWVSENKRFALKGLKVHAIRSRGLEPIPDLTWWPLQG
jgi:hypothetical protein